MAEQDEKKPQGGAQGAQEPVAEANGGARAEQAPATAGAPAKARRFTLREKVLACVACVGVVAAAAGFGLYASVLVPAGAAAKVNDAYIAESDVATWIAQYRASYGLEDDEDFASALLSQNMNVATFRQSAVNQLALSEVINQRADELGISISDEQAQEQLEAAKQSYAFGDDDIWQETLDDYGMTEEGLLAQYKTNLAEEAICEADVERREADDDEVLYYLQTYLAETTQKHAYRIVFTGDDATERAQACLDSLRAQQEAGTLGVEAFSAAAREYSDEDGVDESGGSYAWSGSYMADEAKEALEYVEVGELSEVESVAEDDAVEIFFVDAEYTFPSASDMGTLPDDVPDDLMDEVREAADAYVWDVDCNAYLASLLSAAKITYYPLPDDAEYNVDLY